MTPEQHCKIREYGLKIKELLFDFTGSVTYHLSKTKGDVKIEVKGIDIAKAKN